MKKSTSGKASPSTPRPRSAPSHGEIALRAEALWRHKGCPDGCDDEIWLEAELQLQARGGKRIAFDSDAVMAELDEQFPGATGMATTSL